MLDGLNPYPAYKDSGVPWLGEVPEHWQVEPALAAYKPRLVRNAGMAEKTVLSLSYGRIIIKPAEKLRGLVPESFETYQIVDPGNIIVRTTDLQNDQTSLRVGHARDRGIITSAYMCLSTTDRVDNSFGYQFLNAYDLLKIIYGYGSGLRQNLDFGQIKRMPVLVPPLPEQAAIVRFLDHADRRIRRYIRAKQKLIKLLEEQKQAIIHQAVTRGLDPNVKLKPSGVEWLGEVPEHWEVRQLRRLVARGTTITYGIVQAGPDTPDGVPYIRTSDMKGDALPMHGYLRTTALIDRAYRRSKVDVGDLVVAIRATLGKGLLVPDGLAGANLTQGTARVSPGADLLPQYLLRAFNAGCCQRQIQAMAKGTTFLEITLAMLRRVALAIPPLPEQRRIVEHMEAATGPMGQIAQAAASEIPLLRELRTRLIADVVTGKLDVREAAALLPDETDEPEPLDEPESLEEDEGLADEDGVGESDGDE